MKYISLTIFIAIFLTACHSAPTPVKSKDTFQLPAFSFVADSRFIILDNRADTTWGTGVPNFWLDSEQNTVSVSRDMQPDSVPAKYRSLMNSQVIVYDDKGSALEATITGFALYTTVVPYFGQEQEWNEQHTSTLDKAMEISRMSEPLLVARFIIKKKLAKTILRFAIPAGQALPGIYNRQDKDTTYKTILNNTLYTSAEFKKIQQTYDSTSENPGSKWWEDEGEQYWMTFSQQHTTQIITSTYTAGNPCSDGFYAERLFIWKMNAANTPELIGTLPGDYTPLMAVDMDHDGIPEILAAKALKTYVFLKRQGNEWTEMNTWEIPYFHCPC